MPFPVEITGYYTESVEPGSAAILIGIMLTILVVLKIRDRRK